MNKNALTVEMLENLLKEAGPDGLTTPEIIDKLDFNVSRFTVDRRINDSINIGVRTSKRPRGGHPISHYFFQPTMEEKEPEQKEEEIPVKKDSPFRNSEGYYDPTAGAAINRVNPAYGEFQPGAMYRDDKNKWFLVLRSYPDTILGYWVQEVDKGNVSTDSTVVWTSGPHDYLINTHRVCSLNWRKLNKQTFQRCPFETVKEMLRKSPFQACRAIEVPVIIDRDNPPVEIVKEVEVPVEVIKEVPVEVVKEVEVIKEVPVEVVKEVPVDTGKYDTELALAYQRIGLLTDFNKELCEILKGSSNVRNK